MSCPNSAIKNNAANPKTVKKPSRTSETLTALLSIFEEVNDHTMICLFGQTLPAEAGVQVIPVMAARFYTMSSIGTDLRKVAGPALR